MYLIFFQFTTIICNNFGGGASIYIVWPRAAQAFFNIFFYMTLG